MAPKLTYDEVLGGKGQDYDVVGKVSSQSVERYTGKSWKTWVLLLDKAGARHLTHKEIVGLLRKKYRLTPWWQQGVALGFEIATGRRKVGQDLKGKYMVTATKSLHRDVTAVWTLLLSAKGLEIWLRPLSKVAIKPNSPFETKDGFFGEIRTVTKHRKIRLSWQDPEWEKRTTVEMILVKRPERKSILVFNHTGIPDEGTRELLRKRWRIAADRLAEI
jgi:uncharacterized protein YndB with AHSA1/START domain